MAGGENVRRLARELTGRLDRLERAQNVPQLDRSSFEGSIGHYDPVTGELDARIGRQPDGSVGMFPLRGPVPPVPAGLEAEGGPAAVTAVWGGTYAGGEPGKLDFAAVEFYAAPEPFEYIEEATLVGAVHDPDGGRVTFARPIGTWHVGAVTLSAAGRRSALSELVTATASSVLDSEVLDELDRELGRLSDDLAELDETTLPGLRGDLDVLRTETLPALETALGGLETDVDALGEDLVSARGRLDTVEDETLPALRGDLDVLTGDTIPELQGIVGPLPGQVEAALAAAESAREQGANLIRNPSFEDGLAGWEPDDNLSVGTTARSGSQSAAIDLSTAEVGLAPDRFVTLDDGDALHVEAWVTRTAATVLIVTGSMVTLRVERQTTAGTSYEDLDAIGGRAIPQNEWVRLAGTYRHEGETAEVRLIVHKNEGRGAYYVDDVRAVDVSHADRALREAEELAGQVGTLRDDLDGAAGRLDTLRDETLPELAGRLEDVEWDVRNFSAEWITAGELGADRIAVNELAVAIADVIELNAGMITAGALNADRLATNKLTVELASVLRLDAGCITAGELGADRIAVNELAVAIADVIELNAGTITAGELGADRIATNELAVALASVLRLDAGVITAGELGADRIAVNELAVAIADVIELNAGTITAGELGADRIATDELAVALASGLRLDAGVITRG
ncbi:carbohydrate binding domain-containing protein [Georgenia sp. MJ170]|uniref:carbohydrate binding domain-containing protein n=1 Tax=Georgenia sunbinii TaxID=3117728 RepID=UPI002F26AE50